MSRVKVPTKINKPFHTYTVKRIDEFLATLDKDILGIKNVADVFINVRKARFSVRKVNLLREIKKLYPELVPPILALLKWNCDKNIESNLPRGEVYHLLKPYNENDPNNTTIQKEYKNFYIFIKGATKLSKVQVEAYYINLLNRLHPDERTLMCDVKDKNLYYRYKIFPEMIRQAFPELVF
ncbi:MAG: DUF6433 family protein [candidate division WOR-3 bacterium]